MPHKGKTNETTIPLNNKNNVTSNYMYQKEWISETNIHEESKKNTSEEFPSSHMMESFKKDYQFAKMLYQSYPDHFVNTIEMLDKKNGGVVLVEKEDGEGLEVYLEKKNKLEIEEFLKIAIEMTKSLHFAHSKHIVHRDVKLANFVISSKSDSVKLIDFGLSVMVSRKSPSVSCTKPTGSFDYMSPEQTGKTSKNVDFRSDIYSLAISFYELLTGELPFSGDLLALVHAHITKKIPEVKNIPKVLNDLIQKMCSKNPNDRYKSTLGVLKDLEFIQKNLDSIPDSFQVGLQDVEEFQIPNKLYGREKELKWLKEEIIDTNKSHMCLVSGFSGMGKTRLVEGLIKENDINLIMSYGKFDQFNRLTPYSAFINAMRSLVHKVASENPEKKQSMCRMLQHDLKKELGGVLCSVVPEVEILIGKHEIPKPMATIQDTQERLFDTFVKYLNCFSKFNTLVLVLDDLQWADAASFEFLVKLLTIKKDGIFIIGAYRDNEIGENHPLTRVINENKSISILELQPLKIEHLNEMIADTFHTTTKKTLKLCELIHKKTLGNPFFSREFINALYQDQLVVYKNGVWSWEIEKVEKIDFSSNVIEFMILNLKKKPKNMQKVLNRAACIGNTFKFKELQLVWDEKSDLEFELFEAIKEGWIEQINSSEYKFYHDRLQQSAYELYDKEEAKKIHFVIGNILLEEYKKENSLDSHIFEVVNHLNKSKSIDLERKELSNLNLMAANKSLKNSAFYSALEFSTFALELLPENSWEIEYEMSLNTHSVHADTLYANSMLKQSEEEYNILLARASGRYDKLTVYQNFMKMASLSHQYDKAFEIFVNAMKMFDLTKEIPFGDEKAMWNWILILKKKIDIEVKKIGGLKKFTNLKYTMEKDWVLLLNVMFESLDISFLAPSASRYVVLANSLVAYYLYLTRGLNENAVIGLSLCGMFCSFFFKENEGHELTLLAEQLFSQNKKPSFNVVSAHFHIGVGHITGGSFKQINYHMESGTRYAQNHGEYVFGGYTIWQSLSNFIFNGENLQVLLAKMKKYQAWLKKIKNYMMYDYTETFIQFVLDLSGVSEWNPQYLIPNIKTLKCADTLFPAMEGILNYHKGEYNEALRLFEISEPVIEHDKALIEYYEMKFYHCLTLIHIYKKSKNQKHLERAKQYVEEYQAFGRISSEYLEPRYKLMEVFYRSIDSTDIFTIADEMEDIIESTRKNGLVVIEAVTNEILLSFCDENNFQKGVCRMYFNNCFEIWRELSAVAKVEQLKKKYFKYISLIHSRRKSSTSSMPSSSNSTISNQSFGEPHMVDLENALLNNFNF